MVAGNVEPSSGASRGVVEVRGGRVRGVRRDGLWSFSGVPFAGSTAGDRRWRPPVAPQPWTGVRECDTFGPVAPQPPLIPGMSITGEPDERSEDCLSLNVWTPALDGGRRPVLVWIHGGGFTTGSGAGNLYRGGHLARSQDVVVVTCNYRLGALGFLAHPDLSCGDEPWLGGDAWQGSGNWGLADQVGALVWVRDHIAEFGGDPANVTVFGESAGGMSVATLLAVPAARGLFRRAVVESGPPFTYSVDQAAARAEDVASRLGVPLARDALLAVPSDALVKVAADVSASLRSGPTIPLPFAPVVDGGLLPCRPQEAVARGDASEVSLLIGTTRDEASFFAAGAPALANLDDAGLGRLLRAMLPRVDDWDGVVGAYRAARAARGEPTSPRDLWVALGTDLVFRQPSLDLADAHRASAAPGVGTHVYLFTWETPAFGGTLGSCHGLEIPFVFGTVRNPAVQLYSGGGEAAVALSDGMVGAWAAFARSGDPSGAGPGGGWPCWDPARRPTMVFGPWPGGDGGPPWQVVERPRDEELAALRQALDQAAPPR